MYSTASQASQAPLPTTPGQHRCDATLTSLTMRRGRKPPQFTARLLIEPRRGYLVNPLDDGCQVLLVSDLAGISSPAAPLCRVVLPVRGRTTRPRKHMELSMQPKQSSGFWWQRRHLRWVTPKDPLQLLNVADDYPVCHSLFPHITGDRVYV